MLETHSYEGRPDNGQRKTQGLNTQKDNGRMRHRRRAQPGVITHNETGGSKTEHATHKKGNYQSKTGTMTHRLRRGLDTGTGEEQT